MDELLSLIFEFLIVMKLAIVTSHPIQYNAPWFRLLASGKSCSIKVFYTWAQSAQGRNYDPGFKKVIQWDIPLLNGYEYVFVENIAKDPGTHHFRGIITPGLIDAIKEWNPDCLLVFGWSFQGHLKCLRYFHNKIPVFFRGDSTLLDEKPGFKRTLRRAFLKWVYRHVDIAFYTGTHNKAYFKAHGMAEEKLVFAPHAIDNERFADRDGCFLREAMEWRLKLGFKRDDLVVLFAGKLEPKKDPGILLELMLRLSDTRVKLLIVGNGDLEQELKQKADGLKGVIFLDFQNQRLMPVVYRLGNIFVLPSRGPGETWGLALNEAMASGLPVVASDKVGGAIDLIKPGRNGFVFPAGDLESLYNKIKACMDSTVLREMGKQSEDIIQHWSFESIISSLDSVFTGRSHERSKVLEVL